MGIHNVHVAAAITVTVLIYISYNDSYVTRYDTIGDVLEFSFFSIECCTLKDNTIQEC